LHQFVVPSYAPTGPNKLVLTVKWFKIIVCTLLATAIILGLWGHSRWIYATNARLEALESASTLLRPQRYDETELLALPPLVRRYLFNVLNPNQPIVRGVYLEQTGAISRTLLGGAPWESFTARQRISTHRPGFVWDASIATSPGIAVHVVNAYVAGVGSFQPAVFGLFDLQGSHGAGDMARDELMRYLAESVWYPTALLPSQGVHWTLVDAQSADATLSDGPLTVTLRFTFNTNGLVERISSPARNTLLNGALVSMPWEVRPSRYETHGNMLVPQEAEAAWLTPAGRIPYWRGTLEKLDYDMPR
jgi:hypothetical protein